MWYAIYLHNASLVAESSVTASVTPSPGMSVTRDENDSSGVIAGVVVAIVVVIIVIVASVLGTWLYFHRKKQDSQNLDSIPNPGAIGAINRPSTLPYSNAPLLDNINCTTTTPQSFSALGPMNLGDGDANHQNNGDVDVDEGDFDKEKTDGGTETV